MIHFWAVMLMSLNKHLYSYHYKKIQEILWGGPNSQFLARDHGLYGLNQKMTKKWNCFKFIFMMIAL